MQDVTEAAVEAELAQLAGRWATRPEEFLLHAFPWGRDGLERFAGPEQWQQDLFGEMGEHIREQRFDGGNPVKPFRYSARSGHGIGKSAVTGMVVQYLMSTRPFCRGSITATTATQLATKTFGELEKWRKLCLFGHWFEVASSKGSLAIYERSNKTGWRLDGISPRKENSEGFAGTHAASSSPVFIFDEGSGVDDIFYEVAEGGLTDGEPFIFVFGNPTRTTGKFRRIHTTESNVWRARAIDSRSVSITNKVQIQEWVDQHGEDSDFVRVRVRGEFPRQSASSFFNGEEILEARRRLVKPMPDDPAVIGCDVAREGDDRTIISTRVGFDCTVLPWIEMRTDNTMDVVGRIVERMGELRTLTGRDIDAVFVDMTGVGGGVVDRLRSLGHDVTGVGFGKRTTGNVEGVRGKLWRDEIFLRFRAALPSLRIPDDQELVEELEAIEYGYWEDQTSIRIAPTEIIKRDLGRSPDKAVAACLLFALPVASAQFRQHYDDDVGANYLENWRPE